jgi:hypothetical protein
VVASNAKASPPQINAVAIFVSDGLHHNSD